MPGVVTFICTVTSRKSYLPSLSVSTPLSLVTPVKVASSEEWAFGMKFWIIRVVVERVSIHIKSKVSVFFSSFINVFTF